MTVAARRALVTGGTGHVGAALCRRLAAEGWRVHILSRSGANRVRLAGVGGVVVHEGELADVGPLVGAVAAAEPEVVFHMASTAFNPPPALDEHFSVNLTGTLNLIKALDQSDARVVFTNSAAVYGAGGGLREDRAPMPGTWIGATKAAAQMLLEARARLNGRTLVDMRLFTPYGAWERPGRLIPATILSALAGRPIRTTAGLQRRDFIHMDDVVDALVRAADWTGPGVLGVNIGSGIGVPVREMVSLILELMDNPVVPEFGALPTRPDEIAEITADISVAAESLGWRPRIGLREGLAQTIAWYRDHAELAQTLP